MYLVICNKEIVGNYWIIFSFNKIIFQISNFYVTNIHKLRLLINITGLLVRNLPLEVRLAGTCV